MDLHRPTFSKFGFFLLGFFLLGLNFVACGDVLISRPSTSDITLQGEYLGTNLTNGKILGAQVSARGQGTFRLLLLDGGLPGQGWDGAGRKIMSGTLQGDKVVFSQLGYHLSIDNNGDSLIGTNDALQNLKLIKMVRKSPTQGQLPPTGSITLFDGTSVQAWFRASIDSSGAMRSEGLGVDSGATTKQSFRNFLIHLEFQLPFEPTQSGTSRANSGIYLQKRYEIQILDSFGESQLDMTPLETKQHCGAIWEQWAPRINMTFPPLSWQTLDIEFLAARYDTLGKKIDSGRVTVLHNGITIHDQRPFLDRTVAGDFEGPNPGPMRLQAYGHTVLFKNIWILERSSVTPLRPFNHPNSTSKKRNLIPGRSNTFISLPSTKLNGEYESITPDGRKWPTNPFSDK